MTCPYCNGTLYAKVPSGVAPCNGCEAGRRMIEARQAHATRYSKRERQQRPLGKRGVDRLWKEAQAK